MNVYLKLGESSNHAVNAKLKCNIKHFNEEKKNSIHCKHVINCIILNITLDRKHMEKRIAFQHSIQSCSIIKKMYIYFAVHLCLLQLLLAITFELWSLSIQFFSIWYSICWTTNLPENILSCRHPNISALLRRYFSFSINLIFFVIFIPWNDNNITSSLSLSYYCPDIAASNWAEISG